MLPLLGFALLAFGLLAMAAGWKLPPGRLRSFVALGLPALIGLVCLVFAEAFAGEDVPAFTLALAAYVLVLCVYYAAVFLLWYFRRGRSRPSGPPSDREVDQRTDRERRGGGGD